MHVCRKDKAAMAAACVRCVRCVCVCVTAVSVRVHFTRTRASQLISVISLLVLLEAF